MCHLGLLSFLKQSLSKRSGLWTGGGGRGGVCTQSAAIRAPRRAGPSRQRAPVESHSTSLFSSVTTLFLQSQNDFINQVSSVGRPRITHSEHQTISTDLELPKCPKFCTSPRQRVRVCLCNLCAQHTVGPVTPRTRDPGICQSDRAEVLGREPPAQSHCCLPVPPHTNSPRLHCLVEKPRSRGRTEFSLELHKFISRVIRWVQGCLQHRQGLWGHHPCVGLL